MSSNLLKLFQRLLWTKYELQGNDLTVALRAAAGTTHMLGNFLQGGGIDNRRVPKSRDDLVLQEPTDLKETVLLSSTKTKTKRHHFYFFFFIVRISKKVAITFLFFLLCA